MKKRVNVYLGVHICEKCGYLTTFDTVLERKRNIGLTLLSILFTSAIPRYTNKLYKRCCYCDHIQKLNKEDSELYEQCLNNGFDKEYNVSIFKKKINNIIDSHENSSVVELAEIAYDLLKSQYGFYKRFYKDIIFFELEIRKNAKEKKEETNETNSRLYKSF